VAATAIAFGLVPLFKHANMSYKGYLALGPGGLPYNIVGWLVQACLKPIARRDLADASHYQRPAVQGPYEPFGSQSFLSGSLPERQGAPPAIPFYVAPQRQTTEQGSEEMQTRMQAFLRSVAADADALQVKTSRLEGVGVPAVFVQDTVPKFMGMTHGEIAHVHPEGSSHVTLSIKDAEEVLKKGWGVRHPLSGVHGWLPWTYVLVYAPRNDEEWKVWSQIMLAGCSFIASSAAGAEKIITP
jgi:hypothetical protein